MKFELRKLKSEDMFLMFGILSKIGFKDLKELVTVEKMKAMMSTFNGEEAEDEDMTAMFGMTIIMDVVGIIMKNLPFCKNEIFSFLSALSGLTVEEIADLDMATFTEMIIAVIKKDEFKDFFKVVSGLFE